MQADTILVDGIELSLIIGVHTFEHAAPRRIVVDLEMDFDLKAAAASDHLRDTIDYAAVVETVQKAAQERQFQLIEALAETIARRLFAGFPMLALRMRIAKPGAMRGAAGAAIRISRAREDYAVCGQ
jgi:dihydroneopterin aldolase